jgi:hypothetical protein
VVALSVTSGTIGGWTIGSTDLSAGNISIDSGGTISANYSATTGWKIEADGDAFFNSVTVNNPIITLGKDTGSGTPTTAANDRIKIGDAVLFNRDVSGTSSLVTTKSLLVLPDGDEDNPSIAIDGQFSTMGFFIDVPVAGRNRMQITNGNDNVASWDDFTDYFTVPNRLVLGGGLQAGGVLGTSGQVLQSTGNGVSWANTSGHSHSGITFPNSGTLVTANNVGTSHGTHADSNYLTNNNHSHGNTMTPNNHNHNFGNDITGFDGNNHNHSTQYLSNNHVLNATNPHGITGNNHNHSNYVNNATLNSAITQHVFDGHPSDERLKEEVQDISLGLDFLNRLQPRDFNWKSSHLDSVFTEEPMSAKFKTLVSNTQQGLIAQEVKEAVFAETGSNTSFSGLKIGDITEYQKEVTGESDDFGQVEYSQFVPVLIKAVQQLSSKIDVLEARIDELEG